MSEDIDREAATKDVHSGAHYRVVLNGYDVVRRKCVKTKVYSVRGPSRVKVLRFADHSVKVGERRLFWRTDEREYEEDECQSDDEYRKDLWLFGVQVQGSAVLSSA